MEFMIKYVVDEVFPHATEYLNKLSQYSANETISKNLGEKELDYLRKDLIDYYMTSYFEANQNLASKAQAPRFVSCLYSSSAGRVLLVLTA